MSVRVERYYNCDICGRYLNENGVEGLSVSKHTTYIQVSTVHQIHTNQANKHLCNSCLWSIHQIAEDLDVEEDED